MGDRGRRMAVFSLTGFLVLLGPACDGGIPSPLVRDTRYGAVEGVDDAARTGTWSWKGIPFANPPVGDLRWKAPQEPSPWKGTLAAKAFREASVQFGSLFGPGLNNTYDDTIAATLRQTVGSEDSLYLNIWRPADGDTGHRSAVERTAAKSVGRSAQVRLCLQRLAGQEYAGDV